MENIKKILEALTDGDQDFMDELVEAYLENMEEFKANAKAAVHQEDMSALHADLHKVKPSLETLGCTADYEALHAIIESFDPGKKQAYLELIERVSDRLVAALKAI